MTNSQSSSQKSPFDVTLRLWSQNVPLKKIGDGLQLPVGHLHTKGEIISSSGRLFSRIADQHYFSTVGIKSDGIDEIRKSVDSILLAVENDINCSNLIKNGIISGEIWIVKLHGDDFGTTILDLSLIARAEIAGLAVLFEDYTIFDEHGAPMKVWLAVGSKD